MRIPIAATILILISVSGITWHDQQRLADLRNEYDRLVAQAMTQGIRFDPIHPETPVCITKHPRPDRVAEAKLAAAELLAYSNEMSELTQQAQSLNASTRQRMIDQMERMKSLSGEQLKIFITELANGWKPEDRARGDLINFALQRLTLDYPKDALQIITGSPEMMEMHRQHVRSLTNNGLFFAVQTWAAADLEAAVGWVRDFGNGESSNNEFRFARTALIFAAAEYEPSRISSLIEEFGMSANEMAEAFAQSAHSLQQRIVYLSVLHDWRSRSADDMSKFQSCVRQLAMCRIDGETPSFDFSTRWIDGANLSSQEFESITVNLENNIVPEETGKWIVWLEHKLPSDAAHESIFQLFTKWTEKDCIAAESWLTSATPSPAKYIAARAFAETVFPYDRKTAIRMALSVPEGEDRDRTLNKLHDAWPKDDPAGAAAFAKEYGIK